MDVGREGNQGGGNGGGMDESHKRPKRDDSERPPLEPRQFLPRVVSTRAGEHTLDFFFLLSSLFVFVSFFFFL